MKRILKNHKTTILGLLILLPVVGLVAFNKATLTEASGFVIIAAALLFSKDKEFMENFFKNIKNKTPLLITFYFLLFTFLSCTPQKKLNRLLKKHPELVATTTTYDTAYTKVRTHDSILSIKDIINSHDTIFITKNNVITKIYHKNDSIYVQNKSPSEKVIYSRTINNVTGNTKLTWLQSHAELLLGALLAVLLLYIFKLLVAVKKPG